MIKRRFVPIFGKECGVSLVELMMTVVLIGIIAVITARLLITGAEAYNAVNDRNKILQSSRITLEILLKDLRTIKNKNAITVATSSQIVFLDLDDNQINYLYSNNSLYRNGNLVIQDLSNFHFKYYDRGGDQLSAPVENPNEIWDIEISVNANVGKTPFQMETKLHPRNIQ